MRISTSMMQQIAITGILDRQSDLSTTQQQLASGRRILTPSQDPSGTTQGLRYDQELAMTDQFQRNADRALSRLELEESVLSGVGDALQRVRELTVQGLNDSNSVKERQALAVEVRQRLDEMMKLANTKDGSGEYLFAGYKGNVQPFVDAGGGVFNYQGDMGQRQIQISQTRRVDSADSGYKIFMDVPFSGGGIQDMFKTVSDLADALDANAPNGNSLTDIDAAMDNINSVRAEIGARLNTVDAQKNINEQYQLQLKSELSNIRDLDYAEAVGRMNLQLTGLQAAQATFQKVQGLSLFNYL